MIDLTDRANLLECVAVLVDAMRRADPEFCAAHGLKVVTDQDWEIALEAGENALEEPPEEWRDIPEYLGLYQASSHGRIRSLRNRHGTSDQVRPVPLVMKTRVNWKGYECVSLRHTDMRQVHCLVLSAFKGPRPEGMVAAHLNGIKLDNSPGNLAWATPAENESHKESHGTRNHGERIYNHKLTESAVREILKTHQHGHKEFGARPLARRFGVTQGTIQQVIKGKGWKRVVAAIQAGEDVLEAAEVEY